MASLVTAETCRPHERWNADLCKSLGVDGGVFVVLVTELWALFECETRM